MQSKLITLMMVILMTISVIAGCGGAASPQTNVDVTAQQALKMWQAKEATIIDVRTPEEYREGHIPDAPLIPLSELASRSAEVPKDKKVLIICRSGNRSAQAIKLLRDKGFTNVYNVTGGMSEWRGPVVK
jgi:rhodanese-related sulfurtransferase